METFTEEWTNASLHLKRGSTFRKQQTSVKVHWPLSSLIHGKASPVERVVAAVVVKKKDNLFVVKKLS